MTYAEFNFYREQFIVYLRNQNKSAHTIRAYKADLEALALFWANTDQHLPFKRTAYLYIESCIRQKTIDKKTIARKISCLHGFEKCMALQGIHIDLALHRPHIQEEAPSFLSIAEITHLCDHVTELQLPTQHPHRDKAILELLYATGIQPSQLVSITFSRLKLSERKLMVMHAKKGERIVLFGSKAAEQLELYLQFERGPHHSAQEHLFLNHRQTPLTTRSIQKICNMFSTFLSRKCTITPSLLRHSCAMHLLQQGADPELVRELLGLTRASIEKYIPLVHKIAYV